MYAFSFVLYFFVVVAMLQLQVAKSIPFAMKHVPSSISTMKVSNLVIQDSFYIFMLSVSLSMCVVLLIFLNFLILKGSFPLYSVKGSEQMVGWKIPEISF